MRGKVVENFVRFLRDAGLGRLQQHVDRHRLVAVKLVAQILIVAHRAAGEQQHARLAVDDFDFGLALIVARIAVVGRGLTRS